MGLLAWRMNEDELLLKAISDCCSLTNGHMNGKKSESSQTALASNAINVNGGDAPFSKTVQGMLSIYHINHILF